MIYLTKAECTSIFHAMIKSTRDKQKRKNTRKLVCILRCFLKFSEKCGGLSNLDLTGLILGYSGRRTFLIFLLTKLCSCGKMENWAAPEVGGPLVSLV